jgi:hypothetical protein
VHFGLTVLYQIGLLQIFSLGLWLVFNSLDTVFCRVETQ